jgi:hypothetical protein
MTRLTFFLSLFLFFMANAWAQDVPAAVEEAFNQKYPDAKKVAWASEDDGYEAAFKLKGKKMEAEFDAKGNWLETDTEMKVKDLPEAVTKAIADQFPDAEIEEAERVSTPQWAEAYEVEVEWEKEGKEMEMELVFSKDGKLLSKEMGDEDDDEEEEE